MRMAELDAFEEECLALEETLWEVPAEEWQRPALGQWTLAELVAHLVRTVTRADAALEAEVDEEHPVVDRVEYYRNVAGDAAGIAERARADAGDVDPTELPQAFAEGWRAAAAKASGVPPDTLVSTPRGAIRLDEFLATRVLELVVHHMDVRRVLDLPPTSTVEAERMTMHLLESLLGSPRPRNMGRDRFIRAATGRLEVDDDRFPVLQ